MGWPNYDDGDAASAVPTVAYTPDPIAPTCLVWGPSGGAYTLTTLTNGFPVQPGTGTSWAVTGPLTDAQLRASAVPVSDGGGSLTVDAPVGAPVFVRLSDGGSAIATLPVSLASLPAQTERWLLGTQTTVISTAANSLANNTNVAGSVYDNTAGAAGDGYTLCDVELVVTFGTAPTAGTGVSVWFLQSSDGTSYEDGSASVTPARAPDLVLPVRAVTTAQRIVRQAVLPWGLLTPLLRNDGTGQAFAASGNTLKIRPVTRRRA